MLQHREPCCALLHSLFLIFDDAEVGEQSGTENRDSGQQKCLHAGHEVAAQADGRARRGGRCGLWCAMNCGRSEMSLPTFGLDRDLGPVGCRKRPLPHLVAALGSLREPQVMGDQGQ